MTIKKTNTIGEVLSFLDYTLEGKSDRYYVTVYAMFSVDNETQKVHDKNYHVVVTNRTNYASDYIMVNTLRDALALARVLGVIV